MRKIVFALMALLAARTACADDRGLPVFGDSFDTPLTFAENWISTRCVSADGVVTLTNGGSLQMNRGTPVEFVFEADVAVERRTDIKPTGQVWGGIGLCGWHFSVQPEGTSFCVWKLPEDERSSGKYVTIPDFTPGGMVHLRLVRKIVSGGVKYSYYTNGEPAGDFIAAMPATNADGSAVSPLNFYSYCCTVTLDNVLLSTVRHDDDSPNMIYNSGFEHGEEGLPTYYGLCGQFNYADRPASEYETRFLKRYAQDATEKHSGNYSLRVLVNNASAGISIKPWQTGTVKGQAGVFSVWMKASTNGLPVELTLAPKHPDGRRTVYVTKEWARYEVTRTELPGKETYSPVGIAAVKPSEQDAILWIDDLQAEIVELPSDGAFDSTKTYATEYKPSELDSDRFTDGEDETDSQDTSEPTAGTESVTASAAGTVLGRLNFYMNEAEAAWRVTLSDGSVAVATKPLSEIPLGTNVVSFSVNGKTCQDTVIRLPYKKGATQINHWARCVVKDGAKILFTAPAAGCVGWLGYKAGDRTYDTLMEVVTAGGFGATLMLTGSRAEWMDEGDVALEALRRYGLLYANWSDYGMCKWENYQADLTPDARVTETPEEMVEKFRPYEDLFLTNLVIDEPEIGSYSNDWTRSWLEYMKGFYPYLPVQMNNSVLGIPQRFADLQTDILMIDDYLTNREKRTVDSVVENVDVMRAVAGGKPCWFFIVSNNSSLHYKLPSYAEQIAQSWGCLCAGCSGLAWYMELPINEGCWNAMKQVNREAQDLKEVLLSEELCASATADQPKTKLRHMTRTLNGDWYVLTCNIDAAARTVSFTLPDGAPQSGAVEVLYENRTIPLEKGVFTDSYAGHARHLYKVLPSAYAVRPEQPCHYDDPQEATNAAQYINTHKDSAIVVPSVAQGTKSDYVARVAAQVEAETNVVVVLDGALAETFRSELDAELRKTNVVAALTCPTNPAAPILTKPGFYYWLDGGTSPRSVTTHGPAVLGAGGEAQSVSKPSSVAGDRAFYRLCVGVQDPAKQ